MAASFTTAIFACDTLVALPDTAAAGLATIYAKNADRPSFEWQPIAVHRRQTHPPGTQVGSSSKSGAAGTPFPGAMPGATTCH